LDVNDTVAVTEVDELTDGTWVVRFADRLPETRFPGFDIDIRQEWSPEEAARELRLALREKLRICPLCQRRAQIRRIVDQEVFRVECDRCGRFEIETGLLGQLRIAYEANDPDVVERLPRLSAARQPGGVRFLAADTWRALAEATTS
jgi:hypothetical protein